jgi:uncharacterized membrane protein
VARRPASSGRRLAGSLLAGVGVGLLALRWWTPTDALLAAWVVATSVFLVRCWWSVWPLDAHRTAQLATREDPGRAVSDIVLLWMAAASLVSVVGVLFGGHGSSPGRTTLGLLSIAGSWGVVHTVQLLRYARLYYTEPVGGLDFHDDSGPAYRDFAYLALTVGTTFQVSDTDVTDSALRSMVMRHGLMSFGYSTVVIATTINIVASLGR